MMSLTAQECRMARAALDIGVRELAAAADISPNTIARLERGETLHRRTLAHVQATFEARGVVFVSPGPGGAWPGPIVGYAPGRRLPGRAKLLSDLWSLPNFHHDPEAVFNALLDVFDSYLDIIQSENREPDMWERQDLKGAANALQRCDVFTAYSHIIRGITPPDNQSRDYPHPDNEAASFTDLTMAHFRRTMSYLRSKGYQDPYPHEVI
jgi:transcriptional regulator with XRE-family HTH domain